MKININTKHVKRTGNDESNKFKNYLRMDRNERVEGFKKGILKKFKQNILNQDLIVYPKENSLIRDLSNFLKIKKNKILITPGSDAGLKYIFETFIKKNDKVASLEPSYAMFGFYSNFFKCKLLKLKYDQEFNISDEDIKKITDQNIKIFYLANPNQPTGTSFNEKSLKKILDISIKKNFLVIIDEAYIDFSTNRSKIDLLNKYDSLFITRTFSKAYGMAGIRVGYVLSNEKNIEEVNKVRPLHNVNSLGIKFASYLLKNNFIVKKSVKQINLSKSIVYKFCKKNNLKYLTSETNFVNIFFREKICKDIYNFLKKKKILIRLRNFKTKNKDLYSIRISLGYKKSTSLFLKYLLNYLKVNEVQK